MSRGIVVAAIAVGAVVLSATATPAADAARFAVGIDPAVERTSVVRSLRAAGATNLVDLAPIPAVTVSASRPSALRAVPGVRYVELISTRRAAYVPNDPFLARQWYVAQNRSFDAWLEVPPLGAVTVAVIDSGVDGTHPELQGRITAAKSFVRGSALVDTQGHGTFVAGLIAAKTNDGVGIAGLAPAAELLIAKVVAPDLAIPIEAEAKAIRWAVENGARVINMSFGGLRDPLNPEQDTYSKLEADAVSYAVKKGVLVVAAVGNSDQSPSQPWPYASWPAALPHVLGVSALSRSGASPGYSNRDPEFNDLAAPGEEILSTFPLPLTAERPGCADQGYSSCGSDDYVMAEGTSFATPQVTAAAAMLIATTPALRPDQVIELLQRSAVDAVPDNGCSRCSVGRDRFTGEGRLDQKGALDLLAVGPPRRDRYEPNDGGGLDSYQLYGVKRRIDATLDYWNDRRDVYRVYLRRGQRVVVSGGRTTPLRPSLRLWRPGTKDVGTTSDATRLLAARSAGATLGYRATSAGWYLLDVRLTRPGEGRYLLVVSKPS